MTPSSEASHRSGSRGSDLFSVRPFHAGDSLRHCVMAPGNAAHPAQPRRRRKYRKTFRNDAAALVLDEHQETR